MRPLVSVLVLGLVVLSGCSSAEGLLGKQLYEQSCAVCHRSDGSGSGNRPPIGPGSPAVDLTDDQIAGVIRAGPGAMPSFGRLTDEQVASLVAYVRRLQGVGPGG